MLMEIIFYVQVFFCKYNDPIYVKMEKLEIMIKLASDRNIDQVTSHKLFERTLFLVILSVDSVVKIKHEINFDLFSFLINMPVGFIGIQGVCYRS